MSRVFPRIWWAATAALGGAVLTAGLSGCTTEAFCFDGCGNEQSTSSSGTGSSAGGGGTGGVWNPTNVGGSDGGGFVTSSSSGAGGDCTSFEVCDGKDNNCDGEVDNIPDLHLDSPKTCGTCDNNCFATLLNCKPDTISCTPSAKPGQEPGACNCGQCSNDFYDLDKNGSCEYFCAKTAENDAICNSKDDDCDGIKDEDVDLCTSPTDCGKCGNNCVVLHGTPTCQHEGAAACDASNTKCAIQTCNDGWNDLDGSYATGCEYNCSITNGGVEICGDAIDNDCDGKIDGADDLSGDPAIGVVCYGDPDGECGTAAHAGKTACKGGQVLCDGPNLLVENQVLETCDGKDNDCDGMIDDSPTDTGVACGQSNVAPCAKGVLQCQNGALACVGAVDPQPEVCNGQDDNCDGTIDNATTDSGAACGQSATVPCKLGTVQCQGGVLSCVGALEPGTESCNGVDDDCNGLVDDALTDTGATCGQSGTAPCKLGTVQCQGGALTCLGALNPQQETCDGIDNDCDGAVDDNATGTGVSCGQSGTAPCQLGTMVCQNGSMACVGAVNPQQETCDGQDNDCNGTIDDNAAGAGVSCGQSGTAPCKLGTTQCQGGMLSCVGALNPGTETCNGVDDDCDGQVDDSPTDAGDACGQSGVAPCQLGTMQCQGGALSCVGATNPSTETCDGIDNDCDGVVDDSATGTGVSCGQSGTFPCSLGTVQCQNGAIVCVGAINPQAETCDGQDNDCDGVIDDSPGDVGASCGQSGTAPCKLGTIQCQGGSLACVGATNPSAETCNGVDDDCDGVVDDSPNNVGGQCGATDVGPCSFGTFQCQGGSLACVGAVGPQPETCNSADDDCNGVVDDNPTGVGVSCGQDNDFPCSFGSIQCQAGALVCIGAVNPQTETCNGQDDDCDGQIDKTGANPPADSTGTCNVPPPPPAGAKSPCKAGAKACVAGSVSCQGSVGPTSSSDKCGEDSNCDGVLNNQPNLATDVSNCGACGNDCYAGSVHAIWGCQAGACAFQGCANGYYDLDGDKKCEYACTFIQAQETCNNVDDNCNGVVDEGVIAPSPVQVCGVSPSATAPECRATSQGGQLQVTCQGGNWTCGFPANVCKPNCSGPTCCTTGAAEVCDALDNNCNGALNENVPNFNKPCVSDETMPVPGHGACRTNGVYICNGTTGTQCNAVKADCALLPGGCAEACDGVDNDCDGQIDEPYTQKGPNVANFVKPAVTKITANRWMYTYEASRPSATASAPGTGNGYRCGGAPCPGGTSPAPAQETLDRTPACSVPGKIPWFNVTPIEVAQTCQAMGGFVCSKTEWTTACQANQPASCVWGYNPRTSGCQTPFNSATKFCNLGPSYDFDPAAGDQDGLLPTASSNLKNCYADFSGLFGNVGAAASLFDVTGNLREITFDAASNTYRVMGGSFSTADEKGATCGFDFFTIGEALKLYDLGFRCCFSTDPTL